MPDTASDGAADWIALSLVPGIGDETFRRLLSTFGLPERVFAAPRSALAKVVKPQIAEAIAGRQRGAELESALQWLSLPNNHLLTLADADYPRQLLDISDPPPIIYVKGRRELLNQPAVAIVGSRNATPQGARNAREFATALSSAGLSIVSGLALGIDAAAHEGGLDGAIGSSIAVLGTGLDIIYPKRNREIALRLAKDGVIVSEFALGTPPIAANFPRRNRIISGLSRGVLVVEAAQDSGSLITAQVAAEQGRDVFAIPGSIHSPLSRGCHKLIKQGAKLVETAQDVLEELRWTVSDTTRTPGIENDRAEHPAWLAAMGDAPVSMDVLAARTGLQAAELAAKLMEAELQGLVATIPGGLYQRIF